MKKQTRIPPNQEPFFDERGAFQFRRVSSDARKAVVLPALPPQLLEFFGGFASNCALECCGISALIFEQPTEWDKRWNFNYGIWKLLQIEVTCAEEMEAEVVEVKEFLMCFYKDDWLFFLRTLMENMEKSKQWRT